jgi:hypothetical protein
MLFGACFISHPIMSVYLFKLFQIKGGQPNVLFPSVRKRSLVNSRFRPVEETSQSFDQTLCQ